VKTVKLLFFLQFFFFLNFVSIHIVSSQSKQKLVELAKKGVFNTMSPEEIRKKLEESGVSESEAIQFAKENNLDISKFQPQQHATQNVPPAQTSGVTLQDTTPPTKEVIDIPKGLPPDISEVPKGTHGLEYFGYEIFKNIPAAFEPSSIGPIDPGYLLGADDIIRLSVWGQAEFQYELSVDREGRIFIPNVGQLSVTGIPLRNLEEKLKKQLSKYYSGLSTEPPTVFLDVTIAKLRPIRVFVMGEIARPGGYTINSFATVFNALYSVGGPTIRGSLRNVKVLRENKVIAVVDLYDYLLRGDKSNDVRLQNNDVIFVPIRGKTIAIYGEVKRASIYELQENEHLEALVQFAGGLKSTAYISKAQIDRIIPFSERKSSEEDRIIVDIDLSSIVNKTGKTIYLYDADEVHVFSVLSEKRNYVTIEGSVWRPGKYELGKIRTLYDLLTAAEGTRPEAYLKKADIERIREDSTRVFFTVDLEKVLAGDTDENIPLFERDKIIVYSLLEVEYPKSLKISGHVKFPQTIPYHDSITLYDLIFRAGGLLDTEFQKKTFLERADIYRLNEDKITQRIIPFSLEKLLKDSTFTIPLLPSDEVILYDVYVKEIQDKFVMISGEVKKPGKYAWRTNLDLQSLILEAGGFTEEADLTEADVARLDPNGLPGDSIAILLFPKLTQDFAALETGKGFQLRHRDNVFIRRNPNFYFHENVTIKGEVLHPGEYSLQHKGERLSKIIERADGPTSIAYLGGAMLMRNNIRIITDFEKAYFEQEENHNVNLLPGDDIIIPRKPNAVRVVGEVNNPGLFSFIEGDDVGDYIERAGGETDSVEIVILSKPTGESERIDWYEFDPEVPDGSTIYVKKETAIVQEIKPVDLGETIKDVFAILSSAATLVFLITQVTK